MNHRPHSSQIELFYKADDARTPYGSAMMILNAIQKSQNQRTFVIRFSSEIPLQTSKVFLFVDCIRGLSPRQNTLNHTQLFQYCNLCRVVDGVPWSIHRQESWLQ